MIEVPDFPIARIVTVFASAPQLPSMGVVAFVAGIAVDGSFVLVEMSLVATVACHDTMLAEQRIFRITIMLEEQGFPLLLRMTLLACVSETAVMDIVLLVASKTVGWRLVFE
jgi:hypothetical protein